MWRGFYCFAHAALQKNVVVKKSRIRAGGFGLFAGNNEIKKGSKIDRYKGILLDENPDNRYTIEVNHDQFIDGSKTNSSFARFANTCNAKAKRKGYCASNNANFTYPNHRNETFLRATRRIAPHSEIFAAYGRQYGQI